MKISLKLSYIIGSIVFFILFHFPSPEGLNFSIRPALAAQGPVSVSGIPYIDVHNHLFKQSGPQGFRELNYDGAAKAALKTMERLGIKKMLVMPPPFHPDHQGKYDIENFLGTIRKYPDRLSCLGGGGSLNVMIHREKEVVNLSNALKKQFEERVRDILSKGALGLGEFAVEHFSLNSNHPYESVQADHSLFLLLADIASEHGVPIDIHMEAIPEDMPLPDREILTRSGRNPGKLRENLSGFERLLDHNRGAKIIWAHAGWCNTGYRTPALCRSLLMRHPNLYMSFKLSPDSLDELRPLSLDGRSIKPEWLQLIRDFPERFVNGTDQFYVSPGSRPIGPQKTGAMRQFMNLLPPDLARMIAIENPTKLFNLSD